MNVRELDQNQLDELREAYYFLNNENCQEKYEFWALIPNSIIIDYYDGVDFVPDDFWCTMNKS